MQELQDALTAIRAAREETNRLIKGTKFRNNLLDLNAAFDRIESRLRFMGARMSDKPTDGPKGRRYPPMKSMMGRPIGAGETAAPSQEEKARALMTGSELQKARYLDGVDKLWQRIGRISAAAILTAYRNADQISELRGVAKRARMEDAEQGELTIEFVDRIKAAVAKVQAEMASQNIVDKSTEPSQRSGRVVVNQDQIDADPELQALNARPGDTVELLKATGKKRIAKRATAE